MDCAGPAGSFSFCWTLWRWRCSDDCRELGRAVVLRMVHHGGAKELPRAATSFPITCYNCSLTWLGVCCCGFGLPYWTNNLVYLTASAMLVTWHVNTISFTKKFTEVGYEARKFIQHLSFSYLPMFARMAHIEGPNFQMCAGWILDEAKLALMCPSIIY